MANQKLVLPAQGAPLGNWQPLTPLGGVPSPREEPSASAGPQASALMGMGTVSQNQAVPGCVEEGRIPRQTPGRWGKELTCLLSDSGLFLCETQGRLPHGAWPGEPLTLWLSAPVRPPPGASVPPAAAQLSELPAHFLCRSL